MYRFYHTHPHSYTITQLLTLFLSRLSFSVPATAAVFDVAIKVSLHIDLHTLKYTVGTYRNSIRDKHGNIEDCAETIKYLQTTVCGVFLSFPNCPFRCYDSQYSFHSTITVTIHTIHILSRSNSVLR